MLLKEQRDAIDRYFTVVEMGEREVGVVSKQCRVTGILAPGSAAALLAWSGGGDRRARGYLEPVRD